MAKEAEIFFVKKKKKALKLLLPCLQHREEGGWVFPFSVWATWEDKLGEATQENLTIIFCPLAMHVAPSQELTPWPSVIEVCSLCQDMLWVRFSQRESCCDWQQARVLSFFGSSISIPGWGDGMWVKKQSNTPFACGSGVSQGKNLLLHSKKPLWEDENYMLSTCGRVSGKQTETINRLMETDNKPVVSGWKQVEMKRGKRDEED